MDDLDFSPMQPRRRSSLSSDVASTSARSIGVAQTVPRVNPPPAYVAGPEASDLLSTELGRKVNISPSALALLNEFLDHVLYSIICTAHSVGLSQLKAAVSIVLKPRLGKSAIKVAEEELKDYIEDEEAEELYSNKSNIDPKTGFDTDLVWKLARLRCMVYARMGDLEEEDEEEWLEKEQLLDQTAALSNAARLSMAVNPAAAIFLTSIVEYLGEQALYYAAQHAQKRHDSVRNSDDANLTHRSQLGMAHSDIFLEGKDMNHVGRDSPLSRLWRSWRRNTRSPVETMSGSISPLDEIPPGTVDSVHNQTTIGSVRNSVVPTWDQHHRSDPASLTPSRIPLPISEDDIEEIEGHDLVSKGVSGTEESRRPSSMPVIPGTFPDEFHIPTGDAPAYQERSPLRPSLDRTRSNSLPTGQMSPIFSIEQPSVQRTIVEDTSDNVDLVHDKSIHSTIHDSVQPSERSLNDEGSIENVGVMTNTLGVVGVHHIQPREDSQNGNLPSNLQQPLTSASIKGPGDFDMMYVPEGRLSPEAAAKQPTSNPGPHSTLQEQDSYTGIAAQQLEEHQRYSKHSHEMTTPSIYSNHEHSPRFPRDAAIASPAGNPSANSRKAGEVASRTAATTEQQQEASSPVATPDVRGAKATYAPTPEPTNPTPSYAPTPEPGQFYDDAGRYIHEGRPSERNPVRQAPTDSPVSQMSGKYPVKRSPPEDEPVPELPRVIPQRRSSVQEANAIHSRGHSKSSSSSSRLLGFTRDTAGKPHSIYQQRAAGEMSDEVRRAHSSTPESRNGRPETMYSTNSSHRQHLRVREDSDNNVLRPPSEEYTAQRSLEILINSDETLHYTLTPATANFRDEDIDPPVKRTQTQDLADFFRNTAPPGQENTTLPSMRSRKTSMNATRAPQVLPVSRGSIPPPRDAPQVQAKPKTKNPLGEPRDPKVDRMSGVRDLADYARSTGPSNVDQLPKPLGSITARPSIDQPVEMAAPTSPVGTTMKPPSRPQSRLKFQARDARPSRRAESTALVDFIREGPPTSQSDRRDGPRAGSIRTTAESDDFNEYRSSQPKGSSDTNGIHSVADSQSPLLSQNGRVITSAAPSIVQQKSQVEPNGRVQTKNQRRPKDPYAIEDSDDEIFYEQPPRQKQTNEESLIDFLRNTEPPASMTAQPVIAVSHQASGGLGPERKPSVDRLKDLVRGNKNSYISADPVKQTQNQTRPRAESPHLTQSGSKLDSYRPTQVTHASHIDRNRNKSKARDETTPRNGSASLKKGYGETADLAEYLRNTGPTPAQEGWTQPLVDRQVNGVKADGGGGLRKFFSLKGRK